MIPTERTRGGKREGAGRKPLATGRLTRCYALTQQHVDLVEDLRLMMGQTSASATVRWLIEEGSRMLALNSA